MAHGQPYTEIEVKVHVDNLHAVAQRLTELGAACTVERVFERNLRYENAEHTLTEQGIVLRLRQDNGVRLTYKDAQNTAAAARGIQQRFEAEVTVGDAEAMDTILRRLGFHPYMVYEKYRTTYALDGAEIVLDEMPYGDFVEIEAGDEATITTLLSHLQLDDRPRIGLSYARLFDRVRAALDLHFSDLTFANFAEVEVPSTIFSAISP